MAFEVKKINPLDLQPRKAIGIKLPFSSNSVFTSTYESKEAIKTNLINFFLTRRGERYFNPTFGSGIYNYIFEQLTPATVKVIDGVVRKELQLYFPRVEPIEISTVGIAQEQKIQFSMQYTIRQTNIEDEVVINFEL